jgi:hypothetical protein
VTQSKPLTAALKSRFIELGIAKDSGIDEFADWLSWESILGFDEENKLLTWATQFLEHIEQKKIWRNKVTKDLYDI